MRSGHALCEEGPGKRRAGAETHRLWHLTHANSPAIRLDCRAVFARIPSKSLGQNCTAPLKRQFLMQNREAFRRRPFGRLRESEEAVRKNCLLGVMVSCISAPFYNAGQMKLKIICFPENSTKNYKKCRLITRILLSKQTVYVICYMI